MTSFQKINESKFFLGLITDNFQNDERCDYCISAFLHASYDLLDQILEEYQVHFRLDIPATKVLDLDLFVKYAYDKNHKDAIEVAKIYASEMFKLITDPIGAAMLWTRNTNTHRTTLLCRFSTFTDTVTDNRYFLGELDLMLPHFRQELRSFIEARLKKLNRTQKRLGLEEKTLLEAELGQIVETSGRKLVENDIRKICLAYLVRLEHFVDAIRAKYRTF